MYHEQDEAVVTGNEKGRDETKLQLCVGYLKEGDVVLISVLINVGCSYP